MEDTIQKTEIEQIEEETETPDVSVELGDGSTSSIAGGQELQAAIGSLADSMDVRGFKCAHEQCGLVHSHDTNKHRASDDFSMSEDEAADMEANPNCHCGLGELARRDVKDAPSMSKANDMAPVPESMSRHLEGSF